MEVEKHAILSCFCFIPSLTLNLSQLDVLHELQIQHIQNRNFTILTKLIPHPRFPLYVLTHLLAQIRNLEVIRDSFLSVYLPPRLSPKPTRSSSTWIFKINYFTSSLPLYMPSSSFCFWLRLGVGKLQPIDQIHPAPISWLTCFWKFQ